MVTCNKCGQQITKEDEAEGNFVESGISPGTYRHRFCPDTRCFVCGEVVAQGEAVHAVVGWKHKDCVVNLNKSSDEGYDSSSWIVK